MMSSARLSIEKENEEFLTRKSELGLFTIWISTAKCYGTKIWRITPPALDYKKT